MRLLRVNELPFASVVDINFFLKIEIFCRTLLLNASINTKRKLQGPENVTVQ